MKLVASLSNEFAIKCGACGTVFNVQKSYCTVDYKKSIIESDFLCSCGNTAKIIAYGVTKSNQPIHGVEEGGSFWISGMKIFTWILFVAICGVGIICAFLVGKQSGALLGFLTFLVAWVVAFASVAIMMIFLNMATDLSEIKAILKNRRN